MTSSHPFPSSADAPVAPASRPACARVAAACNRIEARSAAAPRLLAAPVADPRPFAAPVATAVLQAAVFLAVVASASAVHAATPADLLAAYSAEARTTASPARGQQLFTTRHGREWACASCHGTPPTQGGKHAGTGKSIAPLAPAFNAERFSDAAKADKWFRRNCNDVLGRECTAAEKADVLAWLMSFKP